MRAQQHRRVITPQVAQQEAEHAGRVPRIDQARVEQGAVRKARAEPGRDLTLQHCDLSALPLQVAGAGQADQAGADDDNPHCAANQRKVSTSK